MVDGGITTDSDMPLPDRRQARDPARCTAPSLRNAPANASMTACPRTPCAWA